MTVRAPVGDINIAREKCFTVRGVAAVAHRAGSRSYTYFAMRSLRETFTLFEAEGTVFGSISKVHFPSISWLTAPGRVVKRFEEQCQIHHLTIMYMS